MKVIAARIWNEPAVCIGFLTTAVAAAYAAATGVTFDAATVGVILLPLASSLGIRQVVSPSYTATANVPADEGNLEAAVATPDEADAS